MRERISPYGGTLETGPREQGGFRVFEALRNPRSTRDRETVKRGPSTATCESLSPFRQKTTVHAIPLATRLDPRVRPSAVAGRVRVRKLGAAIRRPNVGTIERRDLLGGLIHEYHEAAA
jgi:hypothetical protein